LIRASGQRWRDAGGAAADMPSRAFVYAMLNMPQRLRSPRIALMLRAAMAQMVMLPRAPWRDAASAPPRLCRAARCFRLLTPPPLISRY